MSVVYVSPTGLSNNAGTQESPMDILTGLAVVSDSGTVYVMDGIYRAANSYVLRGANVQAVNGEKPILTSPDDTPPTVDCKANVNGLWMGGNRDISPQTAIFVADNKQFANNTVFGYYGGIAEGSHAGITYQSSRFVNCGGGGLYHDIYISGDTSSKIYDNVFVGGEGYKIHCWHTAANTDIQRNFLSGQWEIVLNHSSQSAIDNVLWNHTPISAAFLTVNLGTGTFTHNLFGHRTFGTGHWNHDLNNGDWATVDRLGLVGDVYTDTTTWPGYSVQVGPYNGDGDVLPGAGTNYTHYAVTDLPALLGYSEAQVDAAVAALVSAFGQTVQQIHDDTSIEDNFTILRNVVTAWKNT